MGDIDEILERLAADAGLRAGLAHDPQTVLRGYDLSTADLGRLADALAESDGDGRSGRRHVSLRALLTGQADGDG